MKKLLLLFLSSIIFANSICLASQEETTLTNNDIVKLYNEGKGEMAQRKAFKVKHILVHTDEVARNIIKLISKSENTEQAFIEAAKKYSTCPSKNNGGDLGWFKPGTMIKEFEDACELLAIGSYTTTPIKTQFGWHVIYMENKKETGELPNFSVFKVFVEKKFQQMTVAQKKIFIASIRKNSQNAQNKSIEAPDELTAIVNATKAASQNKKLWLLAIAPENYDKTSKVIYSATSGKDFATTMAKLQGVPEQNSYLLIGDAATTGAVKDTIAKLVDNVQNGDTIYFYYSGHGIPDPISRESFILPKDKAVEYVAKEQELKLSNIYTTLQNSKASKIIAVIDACFSGTTDGQSVYKGVAAAHFKPKSFNANPNGKLAILTAGKDNQFSNSYDEKGHRLFSYFVIKSLLDGRKNIGDIYKDVAMKVKDESRRKGGDTYEQEPQINGNSKLKL
jgi:hypothetical protein